MNLRTVFESALPAIGFALMALASTGCMPEFGEPAGACEEGERRLADDGCNTCVCDGGGWACTEMACVPACDCPLIYAPVCGADGETYGNACEARCADVEVEAEGECAGACPDPADENVSYVSNDPAECAVIDFVCGGDARHFSNDCGCGCIANDPSVCGEGEIMHENQCKTLCGDPEQGDVCPEGTACGGCAPDPDCPECDVCLLVCEPVPGPGPEPMPEPMPEPICDACPAVWAPVCGLDGVTYGNACEADCAGALVAYEGECAVNCDDDAPQGDGPGDTPCDPEPMPEPQPEPMPEPICDGCPEIWAPVCGDDGLTYGNACEARCAGVPVAHEGECEPRCGEAEEGEAEEGGAEEGGAEEGWAAEGEAGAGEAQRPQADGPGDTPDCG